MRGAMLLSLLLLQPLILAMQRPSRADEAANDMPALVEALATNDSAGMRAKKRLMKMGDPAIPYLVRALSDGRQNLRRNAVNILGSLGGKQVVAPLLQVALHDPDTTIRCEALEYVGTEGGAQPEVARAVKELTRDSDPDVAYHATSVWDRLRGSSYDPEEIPKLIEDLVGDRHGWVGRAYARLEQIGKPALPYLIQAAADKRRSRRDSFISAIRRIGGKEAIPPLIQALGDEDAQVRLAAVWGLGQLGKGDARVPAALAGVLHDSHTGLVASAIESLQRLGDTRYQQEPGLVAELCARLESEGPNPSCFTAKALTLLGDKRAYPSLVKALSHLGQSDGNTASAMICAIGAVGGREAVPLLLPLVADAGGRYGRQAARALAEIGDPGATGKLIALARSDSGPNRFAIEALGFRGNRRAVKPLLAIATNRQTHESAREAALSALGQIGDPAAIPPLETIFDEGRRRPDRNLRRSVAQAVGMIGTAAAVPCLLAALDDPDSSVVGAGIPGMARTGWEGAKERLLRLFDRDDAYESYSQKMDSSIAAEAHFALAQLTGHSPEWARQYLHPKGPPKPARERVTLGDMWRARLGPKDQ